MREFDSPPDRRGTNSYKWDDNKRVFGRADLMPFWVADMDFATPEPIIEAINERNRHPVLGYGFRSEEYYEAVQHWLETRHGWTVPKQWLMFCPPSSIVGIYGIISTLTKEGDSIIVPTPNYGPLLHLVKDNGRALISSPLREQDGRFVLDIENPGDLVDKNTRIIILSSPHNPTGRVLRVMNWSR